MSDFEHIIPMKMACDSASRSLQRDFGEIQNLQNSKKNIEKFVFIAQKKVTDFIIETLARYFPHHPHISPVYGRSSSSPSEFLFIINPIDGISNFLRAIPHFAISLSLLHNTKPIASLVFDPIMNNYFFAEEHKGSFCNFRKISAPQHTQLHSSLFSFNYTTLAKEKSIPFFKQIASLIGQQAGVRSSGSIALDLVSVASGSLDGAWSPSTCLTHIIAGAHILYEAGGTFNYRHHKAEDTPSLHEPLSFQAASRSIAPVFFKVLDEQT